MLKDYAVSGASDVFGLQAFRACLDLEFHLRALIEGLVTIHLNGGKMDEYVLTAGTLDEAVALRSVEPFHDTFFSHYRSPNAKHQTAPHAP